MASSYCLWCDAPPMQGDVLCAECEPVARGPRYKCPNPKHLPTLYGRGNTPVCAECVNEAATRDAKARRATELRELADWWLSLPRRYIGCSGQEASFFRRLDAGILAEFNKEIRVLGGRPVHPLSQNPWYDADGNPDPAGYVDRRRNRPTRQD